MSEEDKKALEKCAEELNEIIRKVHEIGRGCHVKSFAFGFAINFHEAEAIPEENAIELY